MLLIGVLGAVLLLRKPSRDGQTERDGQDNIEDHAEREELGEQEAAMLPEEPRSTLHNASDTETRDTIGIQVRLTPVGRRARTQAFQAHLIDRIVIGRQAECAAVIADDLEVSGHHCELIRADKHIFVRDLNSRNGTLVNGAPIRGRHKLEPDDVLLLGRTKLRFSRPDGRDV